MDKRRFLKVSAASLVTTTALPIMASTDRAKMPTGLLSFTYHVTYNEEFKALAQADLDNVMKMFELTPAQQQVVLSAARESNLTDKLWEDFSAELRPEIDQDLSSVW